MEGRAYNRVSKKKKKGLFECAHFLNSIWTKYTVIAIPGSMLIWFIYLPVVAYIGSAISVDIFPEYYGIVPMLWGNVNFWLFVLLVPFVCNLRDFVWK
jgi:phospholipid-transporting ATPase